MQLSKKLFLIRGHKVMIDRNPALFYGVSTLNLNKAVKPNRDVLLSGLDKSINICKMDLCILDY